MKLSLGVLVCWGLLSIPAYAQDNPKDKEETSSEVKKRKKYSLDEDFEEPENIGQSTPLRPAAAVEVGNTTEEPGPVDKGYKVYSDVTWRPQFVASILSESVGGYRRTNRGEDTGTINTNLDIILKFALTETEQFKAVFRPLDDDDGEVLSYQFGRKEVRGFKTKGLNAQVRQLFFEGKLHNTMPWLSNEDLDWMNFGYSVGLQAIRTDDGIVLDDDSVGAVGISIDNGSDYGEHTPECIKEIKAARKENRNPVLDCEHSDGDKYTRGRLAAVFMTYGVHRGDRQRDDKSWIAGLRGDMDHANFTAMLDIFYADGSREAGDGVFVGGAIRPTYSVFGIDTTLRGAISIPTSDETEATKSGGIGILELSKTVRDKDQLYLNLFGVVDDYRAAGLDPRAAGPLGPVGILFRPLARNVPTAMSRDTSSSIGAALGYKLFGEDRDWQVTAEVAGKTYLGRNDDADGDSQDQLGFGVRVRKQFGQNAEVILGGFYVLEDGEKPELAVSIVFRWHLVWIPDDEDEKSKKGRK